MKMECRQIEELMMEYLYQELDAAQTTAYRAHLTGCPQCAAQLAGFERTRQAVRLLPDMDPPAAVTARLLHEAAARRPVQAVEAMAAGAAMGGAGRGRAAAEGKGVWEWLTGWLQPIMSHPGFAAAAGLVIIGGIAGFLALRGSFDISAPQAAAPQAVAPVTEGAPAPGSAPPVGLEQGEQGMLAAPEPKAGRVPSPAAAPEAPAEGFSLDSRRDAPAAAQRARIARPEEEKNIGGYAGGKAPQRSAGRGAGAPADGVASVEDENDRAGLAKPNKNKDDSAADKKPAAEAPAQHRAAPKPDTGAAAAEKSLAEPRAKAGELRQAPAPVAAPPPPAPAPPAASPGGASTSAGAPRGEAAKKKEATKPQAPPPPSSPAANRPPAKAPSEAADDSLSTGVSGGDLESAAVAGAPAPAPEAAAPPPSRPPVTKAKPQPSKQETEARKLHGQARAKANTGDCSAALKLRDRIYRVDPRYFERSVRNDADLTRCSNARKKQQPAREPSRDSKAPASEESAPVDVTSH